MAKKKSQLRKRLSGQPLAQIRSFLGRGGLAGKRRRERKEAERRKNLMARPGSITRSTTFKRPNVKANRSGALTVPTTPKARPGKMTPKVTTRKSGGLSGITAGARRTSIQRSRAKINKQGGLVGVAKPRRATVKVGGSSYKAPTTFKGKAMSLFKKRKFIARKLKRRAGSNMSSAQQAALKKAQKASAAARRISGRVKSVGSGLMTKFRRKTNTGKNRMRYRGR